MISAICLEQVLATLNYEGGTDIYTFITKMLVSVLWAGAIVLMHNQMFTSMKKLKKLLNLWA